MNNDKLIKKYDNHAKMYEKNQNNPTLAKWRKQLLKHAYGEVLEVGIGTGANFSFYNKNTVSSVTGVDFSFEMIKRAKNAAKHLQINTQFIQADIDELDLEHNSYDCIVSTLTLCSYPNPIETLNKFNNWCRKDGVILLLEHSISTNPFLSFGQNMINPLFKKVAGCHCNRDIHAIIEQSNLQLEHSEVYWKNIINVIRASPIK